MKKIPSFLFFAAVLMVIFFSLRYFQETRILKEIISRLEADTRIAEVLVTGVNYDDVSGKNLTTIKFVEYAAGNKPLPPRFFTFSGNLIQFQSLVIRFDDIHIRMADKLRGKSVYLFWKVFMLDGKETQEYEITSLNEVPQGYSIEGDAKRENKFEKSIWKKFWAYALDKKEAGKMGIKNAQIEAPGTIFIPGILYTIKIEHDGGMRVDSEPIPSILKGENIPA